MIVELTQQTQAKLSAWKQHSQTKEVASHVKATQTTLTKRSFENSLFSRMKVTKPKTTKTGRLYCAVKAGFTKVT